jgi:hypothetical protein
MLGRQDMEEKGENVMSAMKPSASSPQPGATRAPENWWEFLQRARKELEASGVVFRRGVDIAADIDRIRGEHERADAIYWEMEWQKHHPEA